MASYLESAENTALLKFNSLPPQRTTRMPSSSTILAHAQGLYLRPRYELPLRKPVGRELSRPRPPRGGILGLSLYGKTARLGGHLWFGQRLLQFRSVQFSSFQFSRSIVSDFCDPMNRSTSGLLVNHQLPEFTQIHVHQVGDATQPSYPLSSSSPPAPSPSQHQGLFQ